MKCQINPKTLLLSPLLTTHYNSTLSPLRHYSLRKPTTQTTHTRPMTSSSFAARIFQLKSDPITGTSEWVIIEDENDDTPSSKNNKNHVTLATTSYLDMLNDTYRNKAYRLAIEKTLLTKPSSDVLDIGAGTGLLSMMAARAMEGKGGRVTACESYLPMVKLMRKVMRANGMERNNIHLINKRSDEVQVGVDIPSRADVLVSEILDSELLGEGLIPSLQNAYDELLVENPKTVPYKATTFGQLVESRFLWRLQDLYNNEMSVSDGIHLVPNEQQPALQVKRQQYPVQCDSLLDELKMLSEPFKIFEFDFWKRPESRREAEVLIKATEDGRVNAVISWWVLQLDQEGTIFYSTAPKWIKELQTDVSGEQSWCDHWKQCVWFVPGKGPLVDKGEDIQLQSVHSDISISYELKVQTQRTENEYCSHSEDFQLILSPEKIGTYSDSSWRRSMILAVQYALRGKDSPLCFVADDSVFLATVIGHLCPSSEMMMLFPGIRERGIQYLKAIAGANGLTVEHLKLLSPKKDCLTMHDTDEKKVDLLVGEPFYYGCEGQLPWKNLRFWKERTNLERMLSRDAQIIPGKGILRACAMFLPDLWSSRRALDSVEGFDHSVANAMLGACGNLPSSQEGPVLPFFVWQCGESKELSERFAILEFDFSKPMTSCSGKAKIGFTQSGICHGFVLWMDWVLDAKNGISVSSGPDHRYWKQGVKLLTEPIVVRSEDVKHSNTSPSVEIEASFDASDGNLTIKHVLVE